MGNLFPAQFQISAVQNYHKSEINDIMHFMMLLSYHISYKLSQ